jgi:hypothetical protein
MLSVAGPISDLVVLRGLFTDQPLRTGAVMAARVVEREGQRGTLLLYGVRVPAQLPPDLDVGDALRVRVQEATPERVVLQVVGQAAQQQAVPPAAYAFVLPGGVHARVSMEGGSEGGERRAEGGPRTMTLRFDSPALGRLDFVLDLDPRAVSAAVHVSAGDPARRAREASGQLRDALREATVRPATVSVHAREETLDVRA